MAGADKNFFNRIIMGDETWCFACDPETKRQSSEWVGETSPRPVGPILFESRSTFQERNSLWSTIVALCIFGCFYLTVFFKLLVFHHVARARIIFRILNSLLMTAVLTMEGI
jgi:hypothetical protein